MLIHHCVNMRTPANDDDREKGNVHDLLVKAIDMNMNTCKHS